jgi:hypothetical protein
MELLTKDTRVCILRPDMKGKTGIVKALKGVRIIMYRVFVEDLSRDIYFYEHEIEVIQ